MLRNGIVGSYGSSVLSWFLKKIYFLNFWLWWVFVAALGLSPALAGEATLGCSVQLLTVVASSVVEHRLQASEVSSCCGWA